MNYQNRDTHHRPPSPHHQPEIEGSPLGERSPAYLFLLPLAILLLSALPETGMGLSLLVGQKTSHALLLYLGLALTTAGLIGVLLASRHGPLALSALSLIMGAQLAGARLLAGDISPALRPLTVAPDTASLPALLAASLLVLLVLFLRGRLGPYALFVALPDEEWWSRVLYLTVALAVLLALYRLVFIPGPPLSPTVENGEMPVLMAALTSWAVLGSLAVELAYRGLLLGLLIPAVGAEAALVLSALAYGVSFLVGFPAGPAGFLFGVAYGLLAGLLTLTRRSLLPALTLHALSAILIVNFAWEPIARLVLGVR